MANTNIQIDLPEEMNPVLAFLTPAEPGLVAPDPAGYAISVGSLQWQYSITVPEPCVGIYRVTAVDGDGITVGLGWVWIETNDTQTYVSDRSFVSVASYRDRSILVDIQAQTDLIGSGTVFTSPPVTETGQLDAIVIGDDYNKANNRSFKWTFDAIPGFNIGVCTGKFGAKHSSNPSAYSFLVTAPAGDITDLGGGRWQVEFEIDHTKTDELPQAFYDWSVEITEDGEEITIAKSRDTRDRVRLVHKQT